MSSTDLPWTVTENLAPRSVSAPVGEVSVDDSILLHEVYHRLFNHFQQIAILVRDARGAINDAKLATAKMDDLEKRLFAFADLNRLLSCARPAESLESHCRKICQTLLKAFGKLGVKTQVRMADVRLSSSQSLRIALLVAELVTNMLKHGLRCHAATVSIDLCRSGAELVELTASDDCLAKVECTSRPKTVDALARSLGGTAYVDTEAGYVTHVRFRAGKPDLKN
jgi:two-component sensor histidine kinase